MALTSTEEAQLRQLLDQQSQLLTLAEQQSTISSKLSATKKNLSQLNPASSVSLSDITFVRQGATDKYATYQVIYNLYKDNFDDVYLEKTNPTTASGDMTLNSAGAKYRALNPSIIMQTATANSQTFLQSMPNGTAIESSVAAWNSSNESVGGYMAIRCTGAIAELSAAEFGGGVQPTEININFGTPAVPAIRIREADLSTEFYGEIKGSLSDGGFVFRNKNANTYTGISIAPNGSDQTSAITCWNNSTMSGGYVQMVSTAGQNVINSVGGLPFRLNTNSGTVLDVTGYQTQFNSAPTLGVALLPNATAWSVTSQRSTKTDLVEIEPDYEWFKSIETVTGRYKIDEKGVVRSFLIADNWTNKPEVTGKRRERLGQDEDGNEKLGDEILTLADTKTLPHAYAIIKGLINRVEKLEAALQKRRR